MTLDIFNTVFANFLSFKIKIILRIAADLTDDFSFVL